MMEIHTHTYTHPQNIWTAIILHFAKSINHSYNTFHKFPWFTKVPIKIVLLLDIFGALWVWSSFTGENLCLQQPEDKVDTAVTQCISPWNMD